MTAAGHTLAAASGKLATTKRMSTDRLVSFVVIAVAFAVGMVTIALSPGASARKPTPLPQPVPLTSIALTKPTSARAVLAARTGNTRLAEVFPHFVADRPLGLFAG